MIDLTTNEREKEWYVTGVTMSDDCSEYLVKYADGHVESNPFTIHNYNVLIYRMITQFRDKKPRYLETISEISVKAIADEIKTIILSLVSIIFTTVIPLPRVAKLILVLIVLLHNLLKGFVKYHELSFLGEMAMKLDNIEKCFDLLDNFKIQVTDPNTGKLEDWFLVNPTNFDENTSPLMLRLISQGLTADFKKAEGQRISEELKRAFEEKEAMNIKR